MIVKKGCADSGIEDYLSEHSELSGKEVWDYIYELDAPDVCKGCKNTISGTEYQQCEGCRKICRYGCKIKKPAGGC